jgi:septal ring factor EnvC (AmiA/AmiB activator)
LEKEGETAKGEIAKANAQAAQANKDAADSRLEQERLRAAVNPRGMTREQSLSFMEYVKRFSGLSAVVESYGLDVEANWYGAQLISQLESSGLMIAFQLSTPRQDTLWASSLGEPI